MEFLIYYFTIGTIIAILSFLVTFVFIKDDVLRRPIKTFGYIGFFVVLLCWPFLILSLIVAAIYEASERLKDYIRRISEK